MNGERFPTLRRLGRWCLRVAPRVGIALLVLFVLGAIAWTYFNIKFGRELEAKLARLKAQGMPLTLTEAAPKPVPDAQNAAVLYQKVFGQFSPGDVSKHRHIGGMTDEEQRVFWEYTKTGDTALQAQVRDILGRAEVQRDLQTIRQAAQRPYSVFPINWEDGAGALFPHLSCFRNAVHVLAAQAQACAEAGHLDEALDWCAVGLRMSEQAASEPTLIAQLVGISMQAITFDGVEEILSEHQMDPATANKFAKYLCRIDLRKTFTDGMTGERALGIQCFEELRHGTYGREAWPPMRAYSNWVAWPLRKLDELTYIGYMSRVAAGLHLPYSDALAEVESAARELFALPFYQGILAKMLVPVFARVVDKRAEATANIGLCRVVLALKAYKYERGAYPETLDQLEQTLDWQLPIDPFSGEVFVYQRQGEGCELYSIGPDLKDSGGRPRDPCGPVYKLQLDFDVVWECSR